jgi:hypothetical protein
LGFGNRQGNREVFGEGSKWISLSKRDVVWEPNTDTWRGGGALQVWEEKLRNANFPANPKERAFTSNRGTQAVQRGKSLYLGVIRGASVVYPSVEGVLQSEVDPVLQISVEISKFPSLFSETYLQVHNCTKCRQCLPGFFQHECTPSDGETHSEVLLAVPCAGTLGDQRVPCRGPGGPVVNELICDRSGVGQASALQGPVSDQ